MTRIMIVLCFSTLAFSSYAQQANKAMDLLLPVNNLSQAKMFVASNPKLEGKLFLLDSGSDSTELALPLYEQKTGFTFVIGNNGYKIIGIDSVLSSRVSYIYLDGEKYSRIEINQLRKQIMAKYKAGTAFDELALEYNMDGNRTGDPGWFTDGMMVREFETAVKAHQKNDLFTVDIPDRNWYYVVLKTFSEAYIKKLTLIKIKSD